MAITCCKDCTPPKRYVGCHSQCKEYLKEKEEYEKQKEYARAHKTVSISEYDFNEVAFRNGRRKRRRK